MVEIEVAGEGERGAKSRGAQGTRSVQCGWRTVRRDEVVKEVLWGLLESDMHCE